MLLLVQVFVAVSQCILAFSQDAFVVGVLSAAMLGAAKATVRARATMMEESFSIGFLLLRDCYFTGSYEKRPVGTLPPVTK
jgi:hypothetical protein